MTMFALLWILRIRMSNFTVAFFCRYKALLKMLQYVCIYGKYFIYYLLYVKYFPHTSQIGAYFMDSIWARIGLRREEHIEERTLTGI